MCIREQQACADAHGCKDMETDMCVRAVVQRVAQLEVFRRPQALELGALLFLQVDEESSSVSFLVTCSLHPLLDLLPQHTTQRAV